MQSELQDSPLVSVIIPLYNRVDLITHTLDSVIEQTYPHWEVIVVDDGSSDGSQEVVRRYTQKDSRIKCFERDRLPKGGSVCRNIGAQKAQGKYLIFLDSDDLLAPFCLEKRVQAMEQAPHLDYLVFDMEEFYEEPGDIGRRFNKKIHTHPLYMFLGHEIPWTITGPIWKREVFLELDGFNEAFPRLQDPDIHTRLLLEKGYSEENLNGTVDCYYRKERGVVKKSDEQVKRALVGTTLYISTLWPLVQKTVWVDQVQARVALRQLFVFASVHVAIYNGGFRLNEFRELIRTAHHYQILSSVEGFLVSSFMKVFCNARFRLKGSGRLMNTLISSLIK